MEETWYHNMSEENKQRLKEYQKNYHEVKKKKNLSFFLFIGKNGARSYLFRRKWHHKTCFSLK